MLALVGSGEYLPPMQAVDRFLLGQLKTEARVVCLPTAAGTERDERITYWMELGRSYFSGMGVAVEALPVTDQTSANDADLAERIRQASFVYLSGGKPDYLYRTLNGSLAWSAIMEVLNRDGILAGCSAGAMIMGERIPGFPRTSPGFGLLKGMLIMPHFDEIPKSIVASLRFLVRDNLVLLGIESNTAIVGDEQGYQVVGNGGVVVWNQQEKKRYTHGEPVNWR